MTNLFALLGQMPRPWLDPDQLKAAYLGLSAREHPDVAGATADFAEINHAYQTLSDPVTRLRHLLELEFSAAVSRTQPVPEEIAAFFASVAETRQAAETFLKKHATAGSPLAKALLSGEQYEVQERLETTLTAIQEKQDSLLGQLAKADRLWQTDRPAALHLLPMLWQSLGYIARWQATLRESLYNLAAL